MALFCKNGSENHENQIKSKQPNSSHLNLPRVKGMPVHVLNLQRRKDFLGALKFVVQKHWNGSPVPLGFVNADRGRDRGREEREYPLYIPDHPSIAQG